MARSRTSHASDLLRPDPRESVSAETVAAAETPPARPAPGWIDLRLPSAQFDERGQRPFHVDAQLNARQMRALQRLRIGCDLADARDDQGRRLRSTADIVRWLLDALATAAGEA